MRDHIGTACQNDLNDKEDRRCKKKGKFNRFRDAGEHGGESGGEQKPFGRFFLFRFCGAVHGQGCAGQTEYHENKFTGEVSGGVCTEMRHISGVSQLGKKDILSALYQISGDLHSAAYSGLPERHIEDMVEPKGDQRPFYNTEYQGTPIAGSRHKASQPIDAILDNRPDEIHGDSHKQIYQCGNDRDKTGASEKGEGIGKHDAVEAIVQGGNAKSHQDAAEYAHLQCGNAAYGGDGSGKDIRSGISVLQNFPCDFQYGVYGNMHDKKGDQGRKGSNLLFPVRHTDGDAHGKDQRQVVKDGASDVVHDHQKSVEQSTVSQETLQVIGFNGGGVGEGAAKSQKKPCNGQNGDWQHEASSHSLQNAEYFVFHRVSPPVAKQ